MIRVADAVTLCGLICGLLAVITVLWGYQWGFLLLACSILCDRADGWIARRRSETSTFGYYLDALCDACSFCFAPSLLRWLIAHDSGVSWLLEVMLFVGCSVYLLAWVARLARFLDSSYTFIHTKQDYYIWLPVTAGAWYCLCVYTLAVFFPSPLIVMLGSGILCMVGLVMISTIKIPKL